MERSQETKKYMKAARAVRPTTQRSNKTGFLPADDE